MELAGKLAIVTGAASGIGAATTRLMVERGARVFAVDRDRVKLESFSSEFNAAVVSHVADLANRGEVEATVSTAVATMGGLDILVSNAGIGSRGRVGELDPEDWRRVMAINLDATYFAARIALPHLISRRGNIVAVSSVSGHAADFDIPAYNAAKAGLIGLVKNIAIDYARDGLRANAVSPGLTITALSDGMPHSLKDEFYKAIPLQRGGYATEVAEAICFLASDRASYITGQSLVVDGGLLAHTGQPRFVLPGSD